MNLWSTNKIFPATLLTVACLFIIKISEAQNNKRYYTGDNTDENSFNKISKSAQRASRDMETLPSSFSIKQYAPPPGFQGDHGTCVAWSAGYAARTISYCIQHQITDSNSIKSIAFSPSYLYYYVKNPGDNGCTAGAEIENALKVLRDTGDVLQSTNSSDCMSMLDSATYHKGKDYTIKAYTSLTDVFGRITKNEVIAIKKSISEKKPVIFSMKCYSSFFNVGKDGLWTKTATDQPVPNHAICIVGYDDNKYGGAFEILNSWGRDWGNNGFCWFTYDQIMQYGSYALELMDRESYDASVTRSLGEPQLKGNFDFVIDNDFGNDVGTMPVLRSTGNGIFSSYSLSQSYAGGTKFKIKFTTNAPAFVYIFSADDKNVISTLFPYADNVSPVINSTNATVYLPSELKHYTLNADANTDKICVLYSKSAIDFNDLRSKIIQSPSNVYETIQQMFGSRIIPLRDIKFNNDAISFSYKALEDQLVCFFIELNHK